MAKKTVLLIGGSGTLGTYVTEELLNLGYKVDIICRSERVSNNENLSYYQGSATYDFLSEFLSKRKYDGIANFMHYRHLNSYKPIHELLIKKCKQLIFISSYRVYADEEHPIKETSPRLYDVIDDQAFLQKEDYAIPKAQAEDFLFNECKKQNWTIVRPVISFSKKRLDLLLYSGLSILNHAKAGKELYLPITAKDHHAGFDWAGNSGKLIAHLFFKKKALREAFTVYSGHNMTWGDVANAYAETTGVKIAWCSEEEYIKMTPIIQQTPWIWECDRCYDRSIDCSKIFKVTKLSKEDFASVSDGIKHELKLLNWTKN